MRLRLTIHRCRAGAVHTPHVRLTLTGSDEGDHRRPAQILMLSGIGPADHLKKLGVPVLVDLSGVGSHLKDHIVVDLAYMDKTKSSLSFMQPANILMAFSALKAFFTYLISGKGPCTTNVSPDGGGYVRYTEVQNLFRSLRAWHSCDRTMRFSFRRNPTRKRARHKIRHRTQVRRI